jgi:hypothetical protein
VVVEDKDLLEAEHGVRDLKATLERRTRGSLGWVVQREADVGLAADVGESAVRARRGRWPSPLTRTSAMKCEISKFGECHPLNPALAP